MKRKILFSLAVVLACAMLCGFSQSAVAVVSTGTLLGDYIEGAGGGFSRCWLAYVVEPGSDGGDQNWYVELNGQRLGPYQDVSDLFQFDKTGEHIAFAAQRDDRWYIVVDGEEKWSYGSLNAVLRFWMSDLEERTYMHYSAAIMKFSPDGSRLAYQAVIGNAEQAVFVNGQPGPVFASLSQEIWLVNGEFLYWGKDSQGDIYYLYGDREFGPYDEVWDAMISADGEHYAFAARKGNDDYLVADGTEQPVSGEVTAFAIGPSGQTAYAAETDTGKQAIFNGSAWSGTYDDVTELTISPDGRHLAFWGKHGMSWVVVRDQQELNGFNGLYVYMSESEHYSILWDASSRNLAFFTSGDLGDANIVLNEYPICILHTFPFSRSPLTYYVDDNNNYVGEYDVFGLYIDRQALVQYLLSGGSPDEPCTVRLVNGKLAYIQTEGTKAYMVIGSVKEGPFTGIMSNLIVSSDGSHYAYVIETDFGQQLVLDGEQMDGTYQAIYRPQFVDGYGLIGFGISNAKVYGVYYPVEQKESATEQETATVEETATVQESAQEQYDRGVQYYYGDGVAQDYAQAAAWYRKAADQGLAGAQNDLGILYQNGEGVAQDYAQAAAWYRKAAEQGLAEAQFNLALMYEYGEGVAQDFIEAASWYQRAAEQGLAQAQYCLGWMYEYGEGIIQDYSQAASWYRKAVEQGLAEAQYGLGWMYEYGEGMAQDYIRAAALYQKSAEQGLAQAQYCLGWMYEYGEGLEMDYTEAITWYRKAAEQGLAEAQYSIAVMYEYGEGIAQNYTLMNSWFRKAADQGYANAQYALGTVYETGLGVDVDIEQAIAWYELAAQQGFEDAQEKLDILRQ